jgi:hypothetical protein
MPRLSVDAINDGAGGNQILTAIRALHIIAA